MFIKVSVPGQFRLKMMPSFRSFLMHRDGEVHYIGGTDILPAPFDSVREAEVLRKFGTSEDKEARSALIEHNLRLVVYIARKFDNTSVGVEDLISIGTIGLIKAINTRKNPWTINSLAVVAGETMFSDTAYIKETKDLITKERARMYQAFCESPDFKVYKPSGNFMLVRILRDDLTSQELFDRAIREKMMIRDCSTFPFLDNKYIRFCIMNPEDNDRLLHCLLNNE